MGNQLTFTEENVKKNPFDYPKLKLAKGETALLTYVENPYSEYVHNIQKPVLDQATGEVLYKTQEKKDGTEYQTPKLSWVSSPICLGEREVLDADGIDPVNCPVCARAAAGEKGFYPKRRFAMHVIRTNVAPGTFDPTEPIGGSLFIWAFTDIVFNKLFSFNKKFGLDKTDLELGPCTDPGFQKADLNVHNSTVYDKKTITSIFAEKNRSEDPTIFCGSRKSKARIEDDLAVVDAEWAKSKGAENSATHSVKDLSEGIGALLDDAQNVPTSKAKDDVDDEGWAKSGPEEPITSFEDLPETKPAAEKPKAAPKSDSIDDILDNL